MDSDKNNVMTDGRRPRDYSGATPEQIKEEIDRTRCEMDATLNELEEKLLPGHFLREITSMFRDEEGNLEITDALRRAATAGIDAVRNQPVPLLLIGAGLGWLVLSSQRRRDGFTEYDFEDDYGLGTTDEFAPEDEAVWEDEGGSTGTGEAVRQAARRARERASRIARRARDKMSEMGERVTDAAGRAGQKLRDASRSARESMREPADYVRHRAEDTYEYGRERFDEHPIMFSLGALACGFLTGMALPRTRIEDRWLGETADEFCRMAKDAGRQAVERGKSAADAARHAAVSQAQEEELTPSDVGQKVERIAERAVDAAEEEIRR